MEAYPVTLPQLNPGSPRGDKCHCVDLGNLTLWFSYGTLIAFGRPGNPPIVRQNEWGNTTRNHLAGIDGGTKEAKAARLGTDEFKTLWQDLIAHRLDD